MTTNTSKWLKYPGSKWLKHIALIHNSDITKHLPETHRFERHSLDQLLSKYKAVYLKPSLGGGGRGIIRVQENDNSYIVEIQRKKQMLLSSKQLFPFLNRILNGQNYIIQQGIELAKIKNRPIDLRCLIYKRQDKWTYVGTMGKIAAPKLYTTNLCQGGSAITLNKALAQSFNMSVPDSRKVEAQLQELCMHIATELNQAFPNITQLGVDLAIDKQKHLWVLEANTKPRYELFRKHDNPKLYHQINRELNELRNRK